MEFSPWLLTSFKIRKKAFEKMSDALDCLKSTIAPMSAVPDFCPLEEIYSSFFYDKLGKNFSQKQKPSILSIQKSKINSNPIICDRCFEFEQQIARVFESEKALQESGFWDGEDRITGDPYTDISVWVGKNNAVRGKMSDWWFCAPVYPKGEIVLVYENESKIIRKKIELSIKDTFNSEDNLHKKMLLWKIDIKKKQKKLINLQD